jgi:VanZ family protein
VPDAGIERPRTALRVALAWLPALAYMALIWWLSSIPIELPLPSIPWRDKLAHVIEYGLLGLLVARAVRGTWPLLQPARAVLVAALITAGWGYLDELHQAFVPGRDANAFDLLADAIGAVLGAASYGVLLVLIKARSTRSSDRPPPA